MKYKINQEILKALIIERKVLMIHSTRIVGENQCVTQQFSLTPTLEY